MITKENDISQQLKKKQSSEQQEIDFNDINEVYDKRWKYISLSIITLFIILTLAVIFILGIHNITIYNPFETKIINIISDKKSWYLNENIDLFKYKNKNREKNICHSQSVLYDFIVKNSNNEPIYYKLKLFEDNKEKINMKYRLKLNNIYIIGNENYYEDIDKIYLEDIKILENTKCLYTLEWKWEDSDNDLELAKNGLATYKIFIDIYSKSIGDTFLRDN